MSVRTKERLEAESAQLIEDEIKAFARTSPLNRMPPANESVIFDAPLVHFADGDDPLFTQYKSIIAPTHLTPREALAQAYNKSPEDMPERLSVISWILPITEKTRLSQRREKRIPSLLWSYTRWYGEKFNDTLHQHVIEFLTGQGFLAPAPTKQPYFKTTYNGNEMYANWSERHIAYAAGLGTFSLSDGFITERGIAHRCGSVVTDFPLPASPRTAETLFSNCLYYVNKSCRACIDRCPAGAITEQDHDKIRCQTFNREELAYLKQERNVGVPGCGFCQTKVPCEFRNPTAKLKKKTA